jgi:hypothetical protein
VGDGRLATAGVVAGTGSRLTRAPRVRRTS